MHFNRALIGLGLSLVAKTAQAAPLYAINSCSETVYFVYSNNEFHNAQVTLNSGNTFEVVLDGEGYSVGFSVLNSFFSSTTPKLIMGYSVNTDNGLLYYSVTTQDGDPGLPFTLSSPTAACTTVTSPNGVTYACPDTSNLELQLCA